MECIAHNYNKLKGETSVTIHWLEQEYDCVTLQISNRCFLYQGFSQAQPLKILFDSIEL